MDINKYLNNDYVTAALTMFVVVYASQSQVKLPKWLVALFKNDIFRVIYLSLLLMIPFEKSPHVAVLVALVFVITMNFISQLETREQLEVLMPVGNSGDDSGYDSGDDFDESN
jgi:hypothetical protein